MTTENSMPEMSDLRDQTFAHSPETKNLYAAFIKAQAMFQNAKKDSENPAFKSKYADLASCVDAVRKPLGDNALAFFQSLTSTDQGIRIATRLIHASGEWLETEIDMAVQAKTAHGLGTAATYLKRYALSALLGIAAAEDDDDGNSASGKAPPRHEEVFTAKAPPPPPPPVDAKTIVDSFIVIGVTVEQLAAKLGHPPTTISPAEQVTLQKFYREIQAAKKNPPPPPPEPTAEEKEQAAALAKYEAEREANEGKEQKPGTTDELARDFAMQPLKNGLTFAELKPLMEAAKNRRELAGFNDRMKTLEGADRVNAHELYTLLGKKLGTK